MANNPNRPLAPHVQAAIARAAQPKTAGFGTERQMAPHVQRAIARPDAGGTVLPAARPGWSSGPGSVVQRSSTTTVRLSQLRMSSEYDKLRNIWFSYSRDDGKNYGQQVARDFKIATYLNIPPYRTDNHASGSSGGGGEGQKAKEERENYLSWRSTYKSRLRSVTVVEGGGGRGRSSRRHTQEQERRVERRKREVKSSKKVSKHAQWHISQGHVEDHQGNFRCKNCGKQFRTM